MSIKYLLIGAVLSTVLTLSCVDREVGLNNQATASENSPSSNTSAPKKTGPVKVSANELMKTFKEDRTRASELYLEKFLIVDGTISSVSKNIEKNSFVTLKSDQAGDDITVYLIDSEAPKLKNIIKDQEVLINGRCQEAAGKIVIRNAHIFEKSPKS